MTLTPQANDCRTDSPPLQGRGRGGGVSANTIAELQGRAAAMRRNPTEPEKRLWAILSGSRLAGHKFRRQAVIPPYIADFFCPRSALIIEVDGDTHDEGRDRVRDGVLARQGYRVVRVTNHDAMTNIEGVAAHILAALGSSPLPVRGRAGGEGSLQNDRPEVSPHPNPSPEGEGLETVEAQKLQGVLLEGSVG